jgi:hypothetical protein
MKLYTKEQLEVLVEQVIETFDERARLTYEIQAEAEKIVKEFISKL